MKCTKCGRAIPGNKNKCMYCGGAAKVATHVEKDLSCPRCRHHMDKVTDRGLTLDVCGGCGGTWYDRSELATHLQRKKDEEQQQQQSAGHDFWDALPGEAPAETPEKKQETLTYINCPHCQQQMLRKAYSKDSGIVIDICGMHGAFLDAGELDQIVAYVNKKTAAPPDGRKKNNLYGDRVDMPTYEANEVSYQEARNNQLLEGRHGRRSYYDDDYGSSGLDTVGLIAGVVASLVFDV